MRISNADHEDVYNTTSSRESLAWARSLPGTFLDNTSNVWTSSNQKHAYQTVQLKYTIYLRSSHDFIVVASTAISSGYAQ